MADNFNLRKFLSENKLTKNAKLLKEGVSFNGKPVDIRSIEIDGIDRNDYPDFVDAYIIYAEYEDGTPLSDEELHDFQQENSDLVGELIHDNQLYLEGKKVDEAMPPANNMFSAHNFDGVAREAKKAKELMRIANELFPGLGEDGGDMVNLKPISHDKEKMRQVYKKYTELHGITETKLTPKERKLVAIVENALGIPTQAPVAEEEMVQEKPLPKYENIEKLMQEIEVGTNEAACKYKMNRMKEIAEMLEQKVGSLEEGEGADFVDAKKVKQMKRDIMTLRKHAEKLEKEYDKKFGKKEVKKEEE